MTPTAQNNHGKKSPVTTAMILAAGRGSRLAPLTDDIPKPLLEVHGHPLIVHQLQWLKRAGIERVVINLFHLGNDIRQTLGDGSHFGLQIAYSEEPALLETGGGIAHARKLLGEDPFILLNGDIWTDFDFRTLPPSLPANIDAHLVAIPTPESRATGDFEFQHHRLWHPAKVERRNYVYCGISLMRARFLDKQVRDKQVRDTHKGGGPPAAFSTAPLLFLAAQRGELGGQHFSGVWRDIGTLDQLISVREGSPLP